METSLHRALKQLYCRDGSKTEAAVLGYRADVLRDDCIVEIQASPLGAISRKVANLLRTRRVLVVKPIAARKIIVRRNSVDDEVVSRRLSPKRGTLLDVFNDLVRFTRVFPHPNLSIDVALVEEEELRVARPRRRFRRADFRVEDRRLVSLLTVRRLETAADLLALLPAGLSSPFTTATLATHLAAPAWFARRVAYTLRHCGAACVTGKQRNLIVYELSVAATSVRAAMVAC